MWCCLFLSLDVVLGLCMCEPSSQESLQHWIKELQDQYSCLSKAAIIYDLSDPETVDAQESDILDTQEKIAGQ